MQNEFFKNRIDKLNPAEFKTLRESLGLSAQWVADQSGVILRTAQRWDSGRPGIDVKVPEDVVAMLEKINSQLITMVNQAVDIVDSAKPKPNRIFVVRYRTDEDLWHFSPDFEPLPYTCHGAMLGRLMLALSGRDIEFGCRYMDRENYLGWLGDRKDSEILRSAWAAL